MEEARCELRSLSERPMSLSPRTRAIQIVVSASTPTLVLLLFLIVTLVTGTTPKNLVERQRCIRQLQALESAAEPMDDDDRRALELVISSAASGAWSSIYNGQLDPEELEICRRAAAAYPAPSAEDVAWARQRIRARPSTAVSTDETAVVAAERGSSTAQVEPERGGELDDSPAEYSFGIPIVIAFILGLWGAACTLSALIFRGGLSLKLFGLGVRNRRGEMASRMRCAWRSLLVWAPLAVLYGMPAWLARSVSIAAGVALMASTVLFHATAVAYAIRRPARGIQDRIAGTELVPR